MLLVPLVVLPGLAASAVPGAPIRGELSVGMANLEEAENLRAADVALFSPPMPSSPLDARFEIEARSLIINWTRKDGVGAASSPGDPDDPFVALLPAPAGGEKRYEEVRLVANAWDRDANWMVLPDNATSSVVRFSASDILARPAAQERWHAGHGGSIEAGLPSAPLSRDHRTTAGQPLLEVDHASGLTLEGGAWLFLWGINATVTDASGYTDTYASGPWADNRTGMGVLPGGVSQSQHEQFLAIRIENGRLRLSQTQGEILALAESFDVERVGAARLTDVSGRLALESRDVTLTHQVLGLEGDLRLSLGGGADGRRLQILADGHASAAVLDGVPWNLPAQATVRRSALPTSVLPFFVLLTAGGLFTWAGVSWRRRRWSSALGGAETALLHHRPEQARRRLRRLLSRHPDDANAWFLYGATWLQEGDPERVVREIEPVARRMDGADRWSLAFLLALAHARMRRSDAALDWLSLSLGEPLFRERASREPDFSFLRADPRFLRLVAADTPAYG